MAAPAPPASRFARLARLIGWTALLGWVGFAVWNALKPLPPGVHWTSQTARLGEGQVGFIDGGTAAEAAIVEQAAQLIVIDRSPVSRTLGLGLLAAQRRRPNLKIVLLTDPLNDSYGGTPAQSLSALERVGIVVARVKLERLRDANPLYSSLWRAVIGWWSSPFDEFPESTLLAALRRFNGASDNRQLIVADDGAGGWTCVLGEGPGLEVRGALARDVVASELRVAAWSSDDDRLPLELGTQGRGVGSVDARFLTEGAIRAALLDGLGSAARGDGIQLDVGQLSDRHTVNALKRAAARGARVRVLLDPSPDANLAVAGELMREGAGRVDVHWQMHGAPRGASRSALIVHGRDAYLTVGSAEFTRHSLGDLNLEANVELRMPASAAPARAALARFERRWGRAAGYDTHTDESYATYLRYRLADAVGLTNF